MLKLWEFSYSFQILLWIHDHKNTFWIVNRFVIFLKSIDKSIFYVSFIFQNTKSLFLIQKQDLYKI